MYKTYILENPDSKLYIGYTSDLDIRLAWHNTGKSRYTKNKGPWKLIYSREFKSKTDAIRYEKYLKSLKNPRFIKSYIIGE